MKLLSPECNPSNTTTQGTTNLAVAKQKDAQRGKKTKKKENINTGVARSQKRNRVKQFRVLELLPGTATVYKLR